MGLMYHSKYYTGRDGKFAVIASYGGENNRIFYSIREILDSKCSKPQKRMLLRYFKKSIPWEDFYEIDKSLY